MSDIYHISPIAVIRNGFRSKFGVPRQSGLDDITVSDIVMEPEYRNAEAFREIEGFSHLWLLWLFDDMGKREWSPTVRPPKLGGNRRIGVFATRSPNRPNHIGMTVVRLVSVDMTADRGPVLRVTGADMTDGTKIVDIKPYIPYADSVPDALGGYSVSGRERLDVSGSFPDNMPEKTKEALTELLSLDPRPGYQNDPERVYHMEYDGYEIDFMVDGNLLSIVGVRRSACP